MDASVLLSTSGVVRPISRWVAKVGLLLDLSALVAEVEPSSQYLSVFRVASISVVTRFTFADSVVRTYSKTAFIN